MLRFITMTAIMLVCSQAGARNLSGRVYSEVDSAAIIGATCKIASAGNILGATATDSEGMFSLAVADTDSTITLIISMPEYSTADIMLPADRRDIDTGTIYLAPTRQLDGVEVTASAETDARGRTIVYPGKAEIKASSTSVSLFQKLPLAGLEANPINRTLSVDGGTPMILIDGVPSSMDDLRSLQPKDIARIEYSRMTPARYADRGTTGLISVTLHRRTDGGSFYGWARSAVQTAFVDADIRASYHQGPSQFSLTYSPSWRNYQKVYDYTESSLIGPDFRVDITGSDRNPFNYTGNPIKFKYDFRPSEATTFSATFSASPGTSKRSSEGLTSDSYLGDYRVTTATRSREFSPSLDLYLRHDFNKSNSVEVQAVGTLSTDHYTRSNGYEFLTNNEPVSVYDQDVDNRRRSLITELCYTHEFTSIGSSLSAGYQNTISHSRNTYHDTDYRPVLTENNNYFYVRYGQQIRKVYLSASTGAKLFWMKNDLNHRRFLRNISKFQLSWNIDQKWSVQGAFAYSPGIPGLSALTDYPQQVSPYKISNGNPALRVSESFMYQAYGSYRYRKFTASLLLSHGHTIHPATDELRYTGENLFLSQSRNYRYQNTTYGILTLKIADIHGFGASLTADFSHYASAGTDWRHHLNSLSGSIYLWWNHGPFTISYWRKLPGKYLNGQYVGKEENGDMLGVEYAPDKHWTIGASWMYMFDRKGTRYPAWDYSATAPAVRHRNIANNANMVVLSVTYSADFGSIFRSSRRSLNNTDSGSSLLKN